MKLSNLGFGKKVLFFNILVFLLLAVVISFTTYGADQHVDLARSFLLGRLDFVKLPNSLSDVGLYNGKYYWHLPPLHILTLVPFVAIFGENLNKVYGPILHITINYAVFYMSYLLAKKVLGENKKWEALLLAFGFCFATVYHLNFEMAWIYYTLHALCTLFLLLAVYFRITRRAPYWIGIFTALAFLSRYNAVLAIPFLIYPYIRNTRSLLYFLFPIIMAVALVGFYNNARFDSFVDFGYQYTNNFTTSDKMLYELKEKGMFKLSNIPTNFYYYFLKGLDPIREDVTSYFGQTHYLKSPFVKADYPGTSFFIISPIMLYVFKFRPKSKDDWLLIGNILLMITFLLTYYWSGWVQVGPRYMSDVLPFLYLILLRVVRKYGVKNYFLPLILLSAYLNAFLINRS